MTLDRDIPSTPMMRHVAVLLVTAFAVRVGYSALVVWSDGSFETIDSGTYLAIAQDVLDIGEFARLVDGQVVPITDRMPAYVLLLASIIWMTGEVDPMSIAVVQAIFDTSTVLATALAARAISPRLTLIAAAFGCVWPALVVYSSFILTDSLFVTFFAWGLCGCLWAARSERPIHLILLAGIGFGLALLTRPILLFFPIFLFPALVYLLMGRSEVRWDRACLIAVIPILLMALFAVPRLKLTYDLSGPPVFSTQAGIHAMNFVYPCLESPWSCKNQPQIKRRNREIVAERLSHLPAAAASNPVIIDQVRRQLAVELITALPIDRIALGLMAGATKTMFQTVFYEVGDQLKMSPRYFSSIQGETISGRLVKFGDVLANNVFMIVWLLAQSVLLASRVVQFLGCTVGLADRESRRAITFLLVASAYFLVVGGPLGYAKYRLPMEPALIVFLSVGCTNLWQRVRSRRGGV